ncbi:MAG TPA: MFS transporter [Nocardioidaceae bacterium]|nr:MFS transporter [Nocardioidaceae bacterium]
MTSQVATADELTSSNPVRASIRETGASIGTVFRNPGLRRVNLAYVGSMIGTWAYSTAILVWAFDYGGALAVGIWSVVRLALRSVVTPFTSMLADRLPRRVVMLGSDLICLVLVLATGALVWWGAPGWTVLSVATLGSLAGSPFRSAQAALIPQLAASPEELTATNGVAATSESVGMFIGPALGAFLLAVSNVPVVMVVDAASFAWSMLMVVGIRLPRKTAEREQPAVADEVAGDPALAKPGFFAESAAGFRAIWDNRDVRLLIAIYTVQTLVAGASAVYVVAMAADFLSSGASGVGYIDAVTGVGSIIGGFVVIMLGLRRKLASDFGYGVILWGLPLVLVTIWPSAWPVFVSAFIIGAANTVVDVNAATILQRVIPEGVMGRVFGAMESVLIATMGLGAIAMPVLIRFVGLRWGLAVLAAIVVVCTVPALPRLVRIDARTREPAGLGVLRRVPLFAPLDPKKLERIASLLERSEVPAGSVVIQEGDQGDRFYVIESGRVEATFQGRHLSFEGPDEGFGEIALIRDVPRTATITTVEPSVLLALGREEFLEAITGNDEASTQMEALIARRIPTY